MKVTRVQYTVRDGFADENRKNIAAVMSELRALGRNDVRYAVYLSADGRTFMHFVHQNTAEAEQFPTSLASFKYFQAQLKPNLEVPPKVEQLTLIDSATPIF
jgi:homoserine kinase